MSRPVKAPARQERMARRGEMVERSISESVWKRGGENVMV
jgi:hypothetical protein